ncbi:hypothetical protein EDB85DRAFT_2146579 [Lactarius pseudohatsudake]|nr:hypothetical protein EDB85DRAFT_2146579 [Lactarius pseudohatsudake]
MPLNYSKWDQLKVSDDSDIEGGIPVAPQQSSPWLRRTSNYFKEGPGSQREYNSDMLFANPILVPEYDPTVTPDSDALEGANADLLLELDRAVSERSISYHLDRLISLSKNHDLPVTPEAFNATVAVGTRL